MRKCYLSKNYKDFSSAGNKAKSDIETILEENGFVNVGLKQTNYQNSALGFIVTLAGILKTIFSLRKGDILVLQYPLKKYFVMVCNIAHFRGAKIVSIIHDLGSFRRKKLTPTQEIKRLDYSDYLIAYNQRMGDWLIHNGSKSQLCRVDIFDYLSDSIPQNEISYDIKPIRLVYAGGLGNRRNKFLYELGEKKRSYQLDLYGGGFDISQIKESENFSYYGFVVSDELIKIVQGHYGMVWDGDSSSTCTGAWGEYLYYNNPQKASLYIKCLLPIIIWDKAALAPFVLENNIGITIDSLENLEKLLSTVSKEKYESMKISIKEVSANFSRGFYVAKAVNDVVKSICPSS